MADQSSLLKFVRERQCEEQEDEKTYFKVDIWVCEGRCLLAWIKHLSKTLSATQQRTLFHCCEKGRKMKYLYSAEERGHSEPHLKWCSMYASVTYFSK